MGQTAFHKGNFPGSLVDKEISLSSLSFRLILFSFDTLLRLNPKDSTLMT